MSALKENLDESLAIYADVILNPAFAPAELERLKRLQLAEHPAGEEHADRHGAARAAAPAVRRRARVLAADDGLGHRRSRLPLCAATISSAYHDSWFKPNNATMIVVGDTTLARDPAEARSIVRALAARRRAGEDTARTSRCPSEPRVYLIDRPGSEQSVIIAGHLIGKRNQRDDIAVEAMNDILGGAFTSRVNMNLREDKGWSYGADTTVVDTQAQRPFLAIAPVQADQTAASMLEIKREIEEYRRHARAPPKPRSRRARSAAR